MLVSAKRQIERAVVLAEDRMGRGQPVAAVILGADGPLDYNGLPMRGGDRAPHVAAVVAAAPGEGARAFVERAIRTERDMNDDLDARVRRGEPAGDALYRVSFAPLATGGAP